MPVVAYELANQKANQFVTIESTWRHSSVDLHHGNPTTSRLANQIRPDFRLGDDHHLRLYPVECATDGRWSIEWKIRQRDRVAHLGYGGAITGRCHRGDMYPDRR